MKKSNFQEYDNDSNANFENPLKQEITNLAICYFAIFFKFSKTYVQAFKKMKSDKIKEFAANVHFLFTFFLQKRRENSNRIKL